MAAYIPDYTDPLNPFRKKRVYISIDRAGKIPDYVDPQKGETAL